MKRPTRGLLILLGLLLLLAFLLPLALLFSLQTESGTRLALTLVNRLLSGTISLEPIRLSLWPGEIEIRNASLRDRSGCELAGFDRLQAEVSWTDLFEGGLGFGRVVLERPRALLRFGPGGHLDLVDIFTSPDTGEAAEEADGSTSAGFPRNVRVQDLELTGGHVGFEVPGAGLLISVAGIEIAAAADLAGLGAELSMRTGAVLLDQRSIQAGFDRFDLQLRLDRGQGVVALRGTGPGGGLAIQGLADLAGSFPEGFLRPLGDLDTLSYTVALETRGVALESLLRSRGELRGKGELNLTAAGRGVSPRTLAVGVALRATAAGLANARFPEGIDTTVHTLAGLDQGVVTCRGLEVRSRELEVRADGRYGLFDQGVGASFSLNAPDLGRPLSLLGVQGVAGGLRWEGSVSGDPRRPAVSGSVRGRGLRYDRIRLGNLDLRAGLDSAGTLTLSDLRLGNQGSTIRGSGSIQVFDEPFRVSPSPPGRLSLSLRNIEARDFLPKEPLGGSLNGELTVERNERGVHGSLALRGRGLALAVARLGDLNARLTLSEGTVSLRSLELSNRQSRLAVKGSARVLEKGSFKPLRKPTMSLTVEGEPLFLGDFRDGWQGRLALRARLKGRPERPEGSLQLHGQDLDLGFQKLASLELDSTLERDRVRLEPLRLALAPGEELTCTGWVSYQQAYDLNLSSEKLSLASVDLLRQRVGAAGEASLAFSGAGTFKNPRLSGELRISRLAVDDKPLGDLGLGISQSDGKIRVTGNLGFELTGSYDFDRQDFDAVLLFRQTDLAHLFAFLDQGDLGGRVTGRVEARGNAGTIRKARARADLSDIVLSYRGTEVGRIPGLGITFQNERLSTPGFEFLPGGGGSARVKAALGPAGTLDLEASGSVPLRGFPPLVNALPDASGDLEINLRAGGTLERPRLGGEVSLRNGSFTVPELMQRLHDLEGTLRLDKEALTIESLTGKLDEGGFQFSGQVSLDGLKPSAGRLALKAEALPLRVPDTLEVVLNADLRLEGTPDKSLVKGDVLIVRGLYDRDFNLNLLQQIGRRRREEQPPPRPLPQPLQNTALDVSLRSRQPLSVENNLVEMEVRPDLQFTGKLSRPVLNGRAEVVSGTVTYQKKEFVIRKGVIDFLNPYRIEPTLDINGDVKIRKWTVFLTVSGTPDRLVFELSSDPAEQDSDILSLLVLGKTNREISGGKAGGTGSTAQMLATALASSYGQELKKAAGLDVLDVSSVDGENESEEDRLRVTLGKRLSRRITVKYEVETGAGETVQRAISEYRLLENVLASGYQDTTGAFGGKLLYRLEFR